MRALLETRGIVDNVPQSAVGEEPGHVLAALLTGRSVEGVEFTRSAADRTVMEFGNDVHRNMSA